MAEYLSPSIGQIMPQLDQAYEELTRQTLVHALAEYTKQLCEYDPELADILLEGKKTLPRCIRYVTEQAQKVAAKQAEALTAKEVGELSRSKVHGREIPMIGVTVSDDEVYQWAKDYYYGGDKVEPADAMANAPARSKPSSPAKKNKQQPGGTGSDQKGNPAAEKKEKVETAKANPEQMSFFGSAA